MAKVFLKKNFNVVFTGVGCVKQNHNKDTMKSSYCVVIKLTLEQLREELLEQGRALTELLKPAYLDTKAVLAAIERIEFLMQDQTVDISDHWVTARVKTADDGKRFISDRSVREVRLYIVLFASTVLNIWSPYQICCFA